MDQSAAATALPSPPRRLGRYELMGKIASGGMATVYLARATGTAGFERLVALKRCHEHLRDDREFRSMFLDEARLAARIHHPNVVSTIDVSDENGELYLVMEYVEGGGVADLTWAAHDAGEKVPIEIAVRILVDSLEGLTAAHETRGPEGDLLNLVHRDVSPQNLLVGVDGIARVTDFGIAKAEARATVTEGQQVKGKLSYMAPEQLRSSGLSTKTDVFAAAVVLWELLSGERLFVGDSRPDTIQKILYLPIPRLRKFRPEVSKTLERIVLTGLDRDPAKRFPSARAFVEALEECGPVASHRAVGDYVRARLMPSLIKRRDMLRGHSAPTRVAELPSPDTAPDVVSKIERTARIPRPPKRKLAIVVGAAAIVVGAILGVGLWSALKEDPPSPPVVAAPDVEPEPAEPQIVSRPVEPAPEAEEPVEETPPEPEPSEVVAEQPSSAERSADRRPERGRGRALMRSDRNMSRMSAPTPMGEQRFERP